MEFGCTIPLQKQQKIPAPPYGGGEAPIFCWDLHCISLLGRSSLLLVNCRNRYSVILYGLTGTHWARLQETALLGLRSALVLEGFPGRLTDRYFAAGGAPYVTRTHGRREVAFLNRAWEAAAASDLLIDPSGVLQPALDHVLNHRACRCAGHEGSGIPWRWMEKDLRSLSGIPGTDL